MERTPVQCRCGTEDQQAMLERVAQMTRDRAGESSLIQVLHMAQGICGHLPLEVQKAVADGMGIPLAQVSGVVSFYSFFTTKPRGRHVIRVCLGTACYVRGGKQLVGHLEQSLGIGVGDTTADRLFTLEVARCIGACGLAPAMTVGDVVYKQVKPEKLEAILDHYRKGGAEHVG